MFKNKHENKTIHYKKNIFGQKNYGNCFVGQERSADGGNHEKRGHNDTSLL
jgi:hypothetical protein